MYKNRKMALVSSAIIKGAAEAEKLQYNVEFLFIVYRHFNHYHKKDKLQMVKHYRVVFFFPFDYRYHI